MRFAIVGAGAMGSVFGGLLARAGHDVTLVDVDAGHLDAVDANGLGLRFPDDSIERVRVRATTDPKRELSTVDAMIVMCKGWANRQAAESVAHAVAADTWVVTFQNGLGNEIALGDVLGRQRVLPGTTTVGAERTEDGTVRLSPITANCTSVSQFGPPRQPEGAPDRAEWIAAALTNAGLPCELRPDADVVIWTKLAMAATAGPLTAALDTSMAELLASGTAQDLLRAMFDEIIDVAAAEGVSLDAEAVWDHAMTTYAAVGPHLTSMAADFRAGRRSEIDSFCVEVSRRGATHGIATPNHDIVGRLLVAHEEIRGLR